MAAPRSSSKAGDRMTPINYSLDHAASHHRYSSATAERSFEHLAAPEMAPTSNPLTTLLRIRSLFLCALILHQLPFSARAGDPDILTDFVVPPGTNPSLIDGAFFTYTNLVTGSPADPAKFTVTKATAAEFQALMGQSVSYAALVYGPGTVNPPHIHPRYACLCATDEADRCTCVHARS